MVTDGHGRSPGRAFFDRRPELVAEGLIGCTISFRGAGGIIVEAEAYGQRDPASHSFGGETPRCRSMFGPPGSLYVYRIYGVHWCLNIVTEARGVGAAVLIRAIEPTHGLDAMRVRRGVDDERLLCAGPGRLTAALAIDDSLDGCLLRAAGLTVGQRVIHPEVVGVPRIGISAAADRPWRMVARGSRFLSRPIPRTLAA
ncbi:MAG: DNA-3-methyladenine glycosylase [Thermoleophilia bacterium]|nr:DNA-3-methyladenine glycosylase [Thermoleophilia bacterium]